MSAEQIPDDALTGLVKAIYAEVAEDTAAGGQWHASAVDLAATYGASREAVKRALTVLQAEGLVTLRQGVGWVSTARASLPSR